MELVGQLAQVQVLIHIQVMHLWWAREHGWPHAVPELTMLLDASIQERNRLIGECNALVPFLRRN